MRGRVVGVPGDPIGLLPFVIPHLRMMRDPMVEVAFVQIGIHPHALLLQHLVVFGAGQRSEEKEL